MRNVFSPYTVPTDAIPIKHSPREYWSSIILDWVFKFERFSYHQKVHHLHLVATLFVIEVNMDTAYGTTAVVKTLGQ
jgi:hypothetical protein